MNCDDLLLLLDRGATAGQSGELASAARAHMATCPDCARDWSLHERLVARRIPPMPAGLVESCRAVASGAAQNGHGRRGRGRLIVVGLVALAAAASILTVYLNVARDTDELVTPMTSAMTAPTSVAGMASPLTSTGASRVPSEEVGKDAADEPAEPISPFSVYVEPLQNSADDAVRRAAVESYYQAVLQQLRAVPGLTLLQSIPTNAASEGPPQFKVTIAGSTSSAGTEFSVTTLVYAERQPDGGFNMVYGSAMGGDAARACADSRQKSYSCRDPASLATRVVAMLRTRAFPADPSFRRKMQAQLRDPALAPELRFHALGDLASLKGSIAGASVQGGQGATALGDPEVVRGVIDLAAVTIDARQRGELWRAMRGVGSEELLQPLANAARLDPALEVRAQAVATLVLDFRQDPRGRAALEAIARDDASSLLRALAARGIAGDQAWKEYVAASLKDTSRPATERIEALVFHVRGPSPPGTLSIAPWSVYGEVFGPDETAAFVKVYPDAFAGAPHEAKTTLITLMSSVAFNTGHPDVTAMVLDNLEHGANRMEWTMAAEGLLRRKDADPRVRAALEGIAAGSVDAQLRAAAERALKASAAPLAQ